MENKLTKIEWCCLQKGGIRLIEPNERIGKEYLANSDSDFSDMKKLSLKWKNIVAYYACYNSFYALLMKIGIKCEIHDCTIELIKDILGFSKEQIALFKDLKDTRIGVQYYLQKPKEINDKAIFDFILTCRHLFSTISYDEVEAIRKKVDIYIQAANKKDGEDKK